MSFLNVGKKPSVGGIKPNVAVKPAPIKPNIGSATIKPPAMPKIGANIKPGIKPVEPKKEEVKPTSIKPKGGQILPGGGLIGQGRQDKKEEETKEEKKITLSPAPAKEVVKEEKQPELKVVPKEEAPKEEVVEIKEETTKVEEVVETKPEKEETVQETIAEVKEAVEPEESPKEEKPKKATRSRAKKDKKDAEEEVFVPTLLPMRNTVDYEELIANLVITSLGQEWDEMVEQIRTTLKSIQITPDMNPTTMKQATAELSTLRDEIFYDANQAKTVFEGVNAKIDVVKSLNAKGSSPDVRKLNSIKACVHYSENGYDVNLYELLEVARVKHNFYTDVMKQIEYKKNALITMNGALKLEKDLMSN